MQIIGSDQSGNVYAIEHGATRSTLYRAKGAGSLASLRMRGLAGLDEIDWKAIFTGISPIVQGIGAKIAGQPQQPYPLQQPQQLIATAGIGGLSTTTMMMIGGGVLALILIMKR